MPHLIAIEYSEAQRRQLKSEIERLNKSGWPLSAKYDAETFGTWDKLFETAAAPGLFAEREAVVVENAEIFDAFPEKLSPLIEDDKADIVIILVFNSDTKNLKPIAKSITFIKPEAQIPPWKRQAWLISLAKEQGFRISYDAANLLAESIDSQEELRGEILKLGIYADGRNKPNDVAKALTHLRDEFMLPVLTAVTNRLRPALIISLFQGKYTDSALKAAGFDPAKKNYAINKAKSALKFYGAERIKIFMAEAVRLSYLEKTSRAEGWQGFESAIWSLMAKI